MRKIVEILANSKIFKVTISCMLIIIELFLGFYIADIIDINSTKKVEQIKLRAKVAEKKIDVTTELLEIVQEPILVFQTNESDLAQNLVGYNGSVSSCCTILKDHNTFGEWATKFHQFTSQNRFLFDENINLYLTQIYLYDQKLDGILSNIPEDEAWQVGVVLHGELTHMYQTLSQLLQEYLNDGIYELNSSSIDSYSRVIELSPELDIVKYEQQIIDYFNDGLKIAE